MSIIKGITIITIPYKILESKLDYIFNDNFALYEYINVNYTLN